MAPTAGEILFIDTNVLLTATDELRSQHREAQRLITESGPHGLHLAASGQILREYLVVATRPREANGLGLQVRDAIANVNEFLRHLHLYEENEEVSRRLRGLAATHGLHGRRLHDANIAGHHVRARRPRDRYPKRRRFRSLRRDRDGDAGSGGLVAAREHGGPFCAVSPAPSGRAGRRSAFQAVPALLLGWRSPERAKTMAANFVRCPRDRGESVEGGLPPPFRKKETTNRNSPPRAGRAPGSFDARARSG